MPNSTSKSEIDRRATTVRALARAKLHVQPGGLAKVPAATRESFHGSWAPVNALVRQLRPLSTGLLRFWAEQERGHVHIGPLDGGYVPGAQTCGQRTLDGVAHVSLVDLAVGSSRPLTLVGHLLDHLLGCYGEPGGQWLSDGGGITPRWLEVGQQIRDLCDLGYGQPRGVKLSLHRYFAEGLASYCRDRRALNVVDPLLERLLRRTVMSDAFRAVEEDLCAY